MRRTVWSYAAGYGDFTGLMLLADGVVLLAAWLVWTGHVTAAKLGPDRT